MMQVDSNALGLPKSAGDTSSVAAPEGTAESPTRRRRVAFQTLGCKLNQYETDSLAAEFERQGYSIVGFHDPADVYVINTCTVTNKADRKSRNTINQAVRRAQENQTGPPAELSSGVSDTFTPAPGSTATVSTVASTAPGSTATVSTAGSTAAPAGSTADPTGIAPSAGESQTLESPKEKGPNTPEPNLAENSDLSRTRLAVLHNDIRPADAPESLVVVTGCFVNSQRSAMESDGRTYLVDNQRKSYIVPLVEAHFRGEMVDIQSLPKDLFRFTAQNQSLHTRGLLKIQDGCDNFCSFCIIPFVRGRAVSRPLPEILDEARRLLGQGYRELVLTGVNMSRYQWQTLEFADVVEAILNLDHPLPAKAGFQDGIFQGGVLQGGIVQGDSNATAPPDFRVRISSIEPDQISPRFFELLDHPRMTPHLHLCLQSGSERILLAMRRQYTYAEYLRITQELRRRIPDFNITTDLILGFPGEGEEEFQESLAAAEHIGFGHIHTFPYSRRQGTRADRMPGQISNREKSLRAEAIRVISEKSKAVYRRSFIGKEQWVLVEKVVHHRGKLIAQGLGEHYLPVQFRLPDSEVPQDEMGSGALKSSSSKVQGRKKPSVVQASLAKNRFFRVRIVGLEDGDDPVMLGEAVGK